MKPDPRRMAVEILDSVEKKGSFAEPLLDSYLSAGAFNDQRDRKLLTELVYGTLRMKNRLDWVAGRFYKGDFETVDTGLKNILRTALYQIMFTDRIPAYAAVNEAVKITAKRYPGRSALVNAVLRNALRGREDIRYPDFRTAPSLFISVFHSHPLWIVKKWMERFGINETAALCRVDNEVPPLCLRVNRLRATREEVIKEFVDLGCAAEKTVYSPAGIVLSDVPGPLRETPPYRAGHFQVQDEASQLTVILAGPRPGERILDVCSGNGGKTTHMAELMDNRGVIIALDISAAKLQSLEELAGRLGISVIRTHRGDASQDQGDSFRRAFDRVFVDPPCSGLGTLRRNPEIKWRLFPGEFRKFPPLQKSILSRAAACVKKGGRLIYSTCSIMSEENEDVVRDFLEKSGDFGIEIPAPVDEELIDSSGFFKSFPHRHGMDGFFAAVLRRNRA
ncbi:MAG: 16S rRNA (cytosine(967)-C(5))-methyltransferase RsmB [Syntrophales bacterium]